MPNEKNPNKVINKAGKELSALLDSVSVKITKAVQRYGIKYKDPFWKNNKQLYKVINKILLNFKDKAYVITTDGIKSGWDLANKEVDKTVTNYIKQKDPLHLLESKAYEGAELAEYKMPLFDDWIQKNLPQMNAFINRTQNGLTISGRVWNLTLKARRMIEETLKSGILQGQSAKQMATIIKQSLKNPNALFRRVRNPETGLLELSAPAKLYNPGRGVYRSAFQNAFRLARTEINMAYRFADFERINQIPFIAGYIVHLSNAHPLPDICDSMTGKYPKNFTFLGWHPACLCYTTTILLTDKQFQAYLDTGIVKGDMYVQQIPKQAKTYIKDNKEGINNLKSKPYWLQQNSILLKKQTKR